MFMTTDDLIWHVPPSILSSEFKVWGAMRVTSYLRWLVVSMLDKGQNDEPLNLMFADLTWAALTLHDTPNTVLSVQWSRFDEFQKKWVLEDVDEIWSCIVDRGLRYTPYLRIVGQELRDSYVMPVTLTQSQLSELTLIYEKKRNA